jgi:hypothetical protein
MNRLDPESAALYAVVGICLVLIGAVLTPGAVSIEQRGAILAGIITALFGVAWRWRKRP